MRRLIRILVTGVVTVAALFVPAAGQAANAPSSPPALSWSPTTGSGSFDFGTQVGAVSQQFTLTNSGGSATGALTVKVSPSPGPFTITADGCTGTSLGPTKSCKVTVKYTPGSGSDTGTLSASSPKPAAATASLTLKGARPQADLAITKTDGAATYTPGGGVTYTLVVTNFGPSTVTGAEVSDVLPSGTTFVSATDGATYNAATNTVSFTTGSLAPGGNTGFQLALAISASATGNLTNTATVSPPPGTTDPDPNNNSATDTDAPTPRADLAITNTDGAATYTPGGGVTYTIAVINNGPSDAVGVSVADSIPAILTGVTWTSSTTGGAAVTSGATGSGNSLASTVNIPAGAGNSVVFTVTGTASPTASGDLINTATVTAPAGTTDPSGANNSATDDDGQATAPVQ